MKERYLTKEQKEKVMNYVNSKTINTYEEKEEFWKDFWGEEE